MNKRIRQYIGLIVAIICYYLVHEGAHFIYAISIKKFKQINFMGLGVQIDIFADQMTNIQIGIFCLVGSIATLITAYVLIVLIKAIKETHSSIFKTCAYYITIAMLFIDPLYLSLLCHLFGGGDMNGISLLLPEIVARLIYVIIFVVNIIIFMKTVLPQYRHMFSDKS